MLGFCAVWAQGIQNGGKRALFALGAELPRDYAGLTNILLLGRGGADLHAGKGHKLTDTIMVLSLDPATRSAVLLSLPRDMYVETPNSEGRISAIVRDASAEIFLQMRQNDEAVQAELAAARQRGADEYQKAWWAFEEIADDLARKELSDAVSRVTNMQIHRRLEVDFAALQQVVDALGGVEVDVQTALSDPAYPDFAWGTRPFYLSAGPQLLDGQTALAYARSRHGNSDFDRSLRQHRLLAALRDKLASNQILASPDKILALFSALSGHVRTDLSLPEMISLAALAEKIDPQHLFTFRLHDDPGQTGGFLVTPARELYGGAFVLVPFLNLEPRPLAQIHAFAYLIFLERRAMLTEAVPLAIENGTGVTGLAGALAQNLERYGFTIADVRDAPLPSDTTFAELPGSTAGRQLGRILQGFFQLELRFFAVEKAGAPQNLATQQPDEPLPIPETLEIEPEDANAQQSAARIVIGEKGLRFARRPAMGAVFTETFFEEEEISEPEPQSADEATELPTKP